MVKKLLSLFISVLLIVSCVPFAALAAEVDEEYSGAGALVLNAANEDIVTVTVSIKPASNVQGLLLDFDKAYSKFDYLDYEILDSGLTDDNVFVNPDPINLNYTDIYASIMFPDGGKTYTKTTALLKLRYKARTEVVDYNYFYSVKELYNSSLNDLSTSLITVSSSASTETQRVLSSISVTAPTKTTYFVGDALNTTGMKVTANYTDGSNEDVTSSASNSGFTSSSAGTKTVTVTYSENGVTKTATFTVTVKAIELSSIKVNTSSAKTTYYVGESFDKTGLVVTAVYNNGNTKDVSASAQYSGFSSTSAGTKTITATYSGKTATFTVTVKSLTVSSVTVKTAPKKTVYYVGDSFDGTGTVLTAKMSDGSSTDVSSGLTFSGFSSTSVGTKTVTVTYGGKSTTFTVTVKAALLNNSSLALNGSAITGDVKLGSTITIKGAAAGGSGSYTYSYYFKQSSQSSWTSKATGTTATSVTLTPGSPVTYNIKVIVKDSVGHSATKTMNVTFYTDPVVNNSSVAASSIILGESIKVTAAATGGTGSFTYSYYFKKESQNEWTTKTADTTSTSVTIKPGSAVKYNVKVVAKDSAGKSAEKIFAVTVNSAPLSNTSKVASTTIVLGNTINITGAATGGSGSYTYTYYFKQSSQSTWTQKSVANTATSVTVKPGSAVKYDIKVVVKDSKNKTASKTFTVTVNPAPLSNTSTVSATSITLGKTFTLKGSATGGSGSYKYSYYYKQDSQTTWCTKSANTTASSVTFKPTKAVKYNFKIIVTDSKQNKAEKTFTVTVNPSPLVNNSKIASKEIILGDTINITGAASGGTSPYKYSYYYRKASNTEWCTKAANTTSASVTVKPSATTKYNIKVVVTDSKGNKAEKTFSVSVVKAHLANNSKVASTSIKLGNTINITGAASGGSGSYTYSYYFKQSTQSTWTAKLENTTSTSTTVKPGSAVKYDVKVVVKDNQGTSVTKTFTVDVTKS